MRWPWRRRTPRQEAHRRAEEAAKVAREQVEKAQAKDAEARQRAAWFREIRTRNHFAESIRDALEGH